MNPPTRCREGDFVWPVPHRPQNCPPPIGLLQDPWDARAFTPCHRPRTLPPITIFDGTNHYPRVF